MERPKKLELVNAIVDLAEVMKFTPISSEQAEDLIAHILYDKNVSDIKGREAWSALTKGIITEREMRNLIMSHSATAISRANHKEEPNSETYSNKAICEKFEKALFGRKAVLHNLDKLDSWEDSSEKNA